MKAPAFQFFPRDWLSSEKVTMMTPAQEGAYIRLLAYDWLNDGIPSNDHQLAVLSRLGEEWLKGSSRVVKGCFNKHPTKPGTLTNPRLQDERKRQQEWRDKCKLGGLNSGISRTCKPRKGSSRVVELNGNSASSSSSALNKRGGLNSIKVGIGTLAAKKAILEKDIDELKLRALDQDGRRVFKKDSDRDSYQSAIKQLKEIEEAIRALPIN